MKTKLLSILLIAASALHAQQPIVQISKVQAVFRPGTQDEFITITDANGRVYKNARVVKLDDKFILRFVHEDGAAALPLADFPAEVKARFRLAELKALKADSSASAQQITSASVTQYMASSAAASSSSEVAGELARIRANADKKWPGNFRMQKYEMETQTQSLRDTLLMWRDGAEGVPQDVVRQIMVDAKVEWKEDHRMVLYEAKTQIEAWKKVNSK